MAVESVTLGDLVLTGVDADGIDWGMDRIAGWGAPAGTLSLTQRPRQAGAWAGDSFSKPRSVVLSGTTVVPSTGLASVAMDRLISAATLGDTVLAVTEAGAVRTATVRRDGDVVINWPEGSSRLFEWSIQLVAPDPRKFGADLSATTGLPSSTGGLSVPFTVPFTIDAVTVSGQVSLTNPGNVSGPVRLRIDGPVSGPIVTHVGPSGLTSVLALSLVLGAGEFVTVDAERQEVLAQGQEPRGGWVTSRGWPVFEPGLNTFSFSAMAHDPGALLTVTASPTWE